MATHLDQVSPDGRWRWDGSRWVPNVATQLWGPRPYESASFRSTFLVVFLAVNAAALVLAMILDLVLIAAGGDFKSLGDAGLIAVGLCSLFTLVVLYGSLIPAIVLFSMWVHRVVRNMPSLGAPDPRWMPAGAVGRCFIPFLNFVHPYLSAADAWRASDPTSLRADQALRNPRPVPSLLLAWWLAYIGGRIVAVLSNRTVSSSDPSTALAGAFFDLVANAAIAAAAVLAILVVRRLTARQDAKYGLIAAGRLV